MTSTAAEAATAVFEAHQKRLPFDKSTAGLAIRSLEEAYAIQQGYVTRLADRHGEPVGYKIGLTSPAMQEMCGIDCPVAGVVLSRRVHPSGSQLSLRDHVHAGIEFEIAVRIGAALPAEAAPFDRDDVARAVAGGGPGLALQPPPGPPK
jgi:2-keto-4-pentenoate hydratase